MSEKPSLVPITQVPALIEAWYGWRPHSMTVYRWTQGVHGGQHKLKTIKRGSRRLTSRGELRRFMREWSGDERAGEKPAIARVKTDRSEKENRQALKDLRSMGFKI